MGILPSSLSVVFDIDNSFGERLALHLVVCEGESGTHSVQEMVPAQMAFDHHRIPGSKEIVYI
jgi:hypothetical protein